MCSEKIFETNIYWWQDLGGSIMSKVFVIPDVHLKPWMFDKAEEQLNI